MIRAFVAAIAALFAVGASVEAAAKRPIRPGRRRQSVSSTPCGRVRISSSP